NSSGQLLSVVRAQTSNRVVLAIVERLLERTRLANPEYLVLEDALACLPPESDDVSDGLLALERLAQTGFLQRVFVDLTIPGSTPLSWDEVLARVGHPESFSGHDWRDGARTIAVRWLVTGRRMR